MKHQNICHCYIIYNINSYTEIYRIEPPTPDLPLHESLEQTVQYMGTESHEPGVLGRGVHTLTVHDRTLKHIAELGLRAKEVGTGEVDHTPVLQQVVL